MMAKGDKFPSEKKSRMDLTIHDEYPVYQLTTTGHANFCMYFTHTSWIKGTPRLIFTSDRSGGYDFFSVDVVSGEIMQLTDDANTDPFTWGVSPDGSFLLYFGGDDKDQIHHVDLLSLEDRVIARKPPKYHGWRNSIISIAPGKESYYFNCVHPSFVPSNLFKGSIKRGTLEPFFSDQEEREHFFDHHIICPSDPHVLQINKTHVSQAGQESTQRMWLLDVTSKDLKPLYKHKKNLFGQPERVGHETWLPDGKHVAFVVRRNRIKACPVDTPYGNEGSWVVGKGPNFWHVSASPTTPLLCADTAWKDTGLWLIECIPGHTGRHFNLCLSNSSWQDPVTKEILKEVGLSQLQAHPHPGWSPDGRFVQFTSLQSKESAVHLFVVDVKENPFTRELDPRVD